MRQLLWGGWTCPACGVELDVRCRPIEAHPKVELSQFVVQLRPIGGFRWQGRSLQVIFLLQGLLGLLMFCAGDWIFVVMAAFFLLPVLTVSLLRHVHFRSRSLTISDVAIRWGKHLFRPDEITAVRVEKSVVIVEVAGAEHHLDVLGDATETAACIEAVRRLNRDTGSAADVPETLRQHRARPEHDVTRDR